MNKKASLVLISVFGLIGCSNESLLNKSSYSKQTLDKPITPNNDIKINTSKIEYEKVSELKTNTDKKYAPFFSYNSLGRAGTQDTEPATGGKLVLSNDGCLLLQQLDTVKIPVFPSKESRWDERKKQMIINGVVLPLGKSFTTSGRQFVKYDLSKFESIANPSCIGDKKLERIGINIRVLNK